MPRRPRGGTLDRPGPPSGLATRPAASGIVRTSNDPRRRHETGPPVGRAPGWARRASEGEGVDHVSRGVGRARPWAHPRPRRVPGWVGPKRRPVPRDLGSDGPRPVTRWPSRRPRRPPTSCLRALGASHRRPPPGLPTSGRPGRRASETGWYNDQAMDDGSAVRPPATEGSAVVPSDPRIIVAQRHQPVRGGVVAEGRFGRRAAGDRRRRAVLARIVPRPVRRALPSRDGTDHVTGGAATRGL